MSSEMYIYKKLSYRWQTARCICAKCNGVADLLKTRPSPYVLPCQIWSFCVKGCTFVGINTGEPPKLGESWNSALLGWKAWLTPRYTPLPNVCYHVKFGSCATKGVHTNRREPPNWEKLRPRPCSGGVAGHLQTSSLPICVITSNLVVLRQRVYA